MPTLEHFVDEDRFFADHDGGESNEIVSGWPECEIREDYVSRADVVTVLEALRDALVADCDQATRRKDDGARLAFNGAVGRVQSAMHQLGIEY